MATPSKPLSRLQIIGISLSLSCLYFFRVYRQLLDPAYDWYFEYDVPSIEIWAALFCSFLVFCVFSGLLVRIGNLRVGRSKSVLLILFASFGFAAFGPLSSELFTWWFVMPQVWFKYLLPLVAFMICLAIACRSSYGVAGLANNLAAMLVIIAPFSILVFGHAFLVAAGVFAGNFGSNFIDRNAGSQDSSNRLQRVVWIVFDEFGQNPLSHRPPDLRLPALDELISNSFVAENAFPPHYWTSASLPALLTGKRVHWVVPHGPDGITLHFHSDTSSAELTSADTVFDDVLSLNGKNAAAGWYHPYPRLFPNKLSLGYWTPAGWYRCKSFNECVSASLANSFEDVPILRDLFIENPLVEADQIPFIRNRFLNHHREHAEYNLLLNARAKGLVTNENIDFVFLHFAIPHGPYLNRNNQSTHSYFEALEAVDETLSILRDEMKRTNLWDRTTLIVSGDHWLRSDLSSPDGLDPKEVFMPENTRVPFIVKPSGGGESIQYERHFNTVITRQLIKSIMTREVSTTEEIASWLERTSEEQPEFMNFHPCRELETPFILNRPSTSVRLLTCK